MTHELRLLFEPMSRGKYTLRDWHVFLLRASHNSLIQTRMASDGEDDYCSDKFLLESAPLTSKKELIYAERRRQNQRKSEIKNVENRKKSRRQLEEEAREEGLKLSLFERAQEEERELGHRNKAIGMMLKMGFKPGETLGRSEGESNTVAGVPGVGSAPVTTGASTTTTTTPAQAEADLKETSTSLAKERHRAVPLSLDVWSGAYFPYLLNYCLMEGR